MPSPGTLVNWIKRGLDIPNQAAQRFAERAVPTLSIGDVAHWTHNDSRVVRPASGFYLKAAVAGNYSHIGLINPVTSAINLVIESLYVAAYAGGNKEYEIVLTEEVAFQALTGAAQAQTLSSYRDTRSVDLVPGSAAGYTIGQMWAGHAVAQVDGNRCGKFILLDPMPIMQREGMWLLKPGDCFSINPTTANNGIAIAWFFWREEQIVR